MILDISHPTLNRGPGGKPHQPGPDLDRAFARTVADGEGGRR